MKKTLLLTILMLGSSCSLLEAMGLEAFIKTVTFDNKTGDTVKVAFEDMLLTEDLTDMILKPGQKTSKYLTGKKIDQKAKFIRFITVQRVSKQSASENLPTYSLHLDPTKSDDKKELDQINSKIKEQKQPTLVIGKFGIYEPQGKKAAKRFKQVAFTYGIDYQSRKKEII